MPIFEDDCYADLIWDGKRPPAIYAMSKNASVIHIGSFSKSIAPALRVGFIVAPWAALSRMLALKTDAGSGALEQMVLAEYCAPHFETHVPALRRGLRAKLDTLMEALNEQFGTTAEFEEPKGGIFLWVKLPDNVDTLKLYQAALAAGVAINPGPEWSTDKAYAGSRLRLCFASPTHEQIREGVAVLAEVCRKEFGVPARIANVENARRHDAVSGLPHRERRLIGPAERHAIDHGLHRFQLHLALALVVAGVDERDGPFHHVHDRDVAGRADLQRPIFGARLMILAGVDGRHRDHLLQRKAHRHELAHHVRQIGHARRIAREHVDVGGDRIRRSSRPGSRPPPR